MLPIALRQYKLFQLKHRHREQAPSHILIFRGGSYLALSLRIHDQHIAGLESTQLWEGASPLPHFDLQGVSYLALSLRIHDQHITGLESTQLWEGACSRWRCNSQNIK